MKSKYKNILIIIIFIPAVSIISNFTVNHIDEPLGWLPLILLSSLFLFNLMVKGNQAFKPYFTNKYNFFTSKYRSELTSDIPQELMYEKMLEVIEQSPFKLKNSNASTHEILASASISWKSWGENIYIDFESTPENKTIMHFCSASFSGITSWGKNESNYEKMLEQFEESLTI